MKILVIVDCQQDFIEPTGALYVPGAETIKDALVATVKKDCFDWIITTHDTHDPEDYATREESKMFPPHCIRGTNGCYLIDELEHAFQAIDSFEERFTKPVFDIWAENVDFEKFVKNTILKDDKIYVCGVATNYCVYWNIKGFVERGYKNITLITKASKGIMDDTYETRLQELKDLGVTFVEEI